MKGIRVHEFGDPSVLKWEEIAEPTPGPGQAVIKLAAIGVNPVETYIRRGIYGPKPFPYTPGSDGAGVVSAIGVGLTRCKVGDRVYVSSSVSGTYAESALCAEQAVHPLPEKISFVQGASIGVPYPTAYRALHTRGHIAAGETVLVHGATGGVGVAAVQLARAAGATVLATGGSQRGREMILKQGAHHVFDHTHPGYEQEIMEQTGGLGVAMVIELAAHLNLARDLTLLAKRGRVIVVGSRGKIEIDPRDTMSRDADIRGMSIMHATDAELAAIHAALRVGLENGSLHPIIGKEFALAHAAQAHEAVLESGAFGKIVLRP